MATLTPTSPKFAEAAAAAPASLNPPALKKGTTGVVDGGFEIVMAEQGFILWAYYKPGDLTKPVYYVTQELFPDGSEDLGCTCPDMLFRCTPERPEHRCKHCKAVQGQLEGWR